MKTISYARNLNQTNFKIEYIMSNYLHLSYKNSSMLKYIALILTCSFIQPAFATKWYVDNAVGSSGNGQSWPSALKKFSDIPWSNIEPGDTIFISGGPSGGSKIYREAWAVGASGTQNAPVVITIDAANALHNGKAEFDFNALGDDGNITGITVNNQSYVTFNGNVNGDNHISVENLRNIYNSVEASCLAGSGSTSIVVDHLDFLNCNNGVRLESGNPGNGSEVKFCNFLDIRGDAAVTMDMGGSTWDIHKVHDNNIALLNNSKAPDGGDHNIGPDGVQTGNGVSVFNNKFSVKNTTKFTSGQHTDYIQQGQQSFLKIYNNEFINIGDSAIDMGVWFPKQSIHDIWIYNNIFRIETKVDPYPQYIRIYASNYGNVTGSVGSINNLKIFNNLFLDGEPGFPVILFNNFQGNPTASGVEIKNNIFYNTSGIDIQKSSGFSTNSFSFAANIYYPASTGLTINGVDFSATSWIANKDVTGSTDAPAFVNYTKNGSNNDLHLLSTDKAAIDSGANLNGYFNYDQENLPRPQGVAWDIGPYEYKNKSITIPPPLNLRVQ